MPKHAALLALVAASLLALTACPKCPQGSHEVRTSVVSGKGFTFSLNDQAADTRVESGYDLASDVTYTIVASGSLTTFTTTGEKKTYGPEGRDGSKAGPGAPLPDFPYGALVAFIGSTPYYIGKGGLSGQYPAGHLAFQLNLPPGTAAPPSPTPAPPNTVTANITITLSGERIECVQDDAGPPKPKPTPTPPQWSELYASVFAPGTAGHCLNCHDGTDKKAPKWGATRDANVMYDYFNAQHVFDAPNRSFGSTADSRIIWCNPSAQMPLDQQVANKAACDQVQAWLAAGAHNDAR